MCASDNPIFHSCTSEVPFWVVLSKQRKGGGVVYRPPDGYASPIRPRMAAYLGQRADDEGRSSSHQSAALYSQRRPHGFL